MQIDKQTFKSLYELMRTRKFKTSFSIITEYHDNILKSIDNITNEGLDNVNFLTDPIIQAVDFCDIKTIHKFISLRKEIQTTTKCYLYKSSGNPSVYETIFVAFDRKENETAFLMFGFSDLKKYDGWSWCIMGNFMHDWPDNKYAIGHNSYIYPRRINDQETINKFFMAKVELVVQIEVFMQYAHLEIKNLKPHHKDMNGVVCRYENKMQYPINIIDSTWYTSLIKSDAFKVRGHFRLQPYGHGLNKRKLIWINEFQKEGYTREAKILNEYPETAGTL